MHIALCGKVHRLHPARIKPALQCTPKPFPEYAAVI